ncbi:MAG: hypothetical protein ABGX16_15610 [Pirellulales bacterium]
MSGTATIQADDQLEADNLPDLDVVENDPPEQTSGPPLVPVEALRDEYTQLEAWVHQSFSALERLHSELDEWQRELTEQQTDLDSNLANELGSSEQLEQERDLALQEACQLETTLEQSQASLAALESNQNSSNEQQQQLSQQYEQACQELSQVLKEVQQLEEENSAQAQELEELERATTTAQAELNAIRKHSEQLSQSLKSEQLRSAEQQEHWSSELKEMRLLLGRQCDMLARGSEETSTQASVEAKIEPVPEQNVEPPVREAEKNISSENSLTPKDKRIDEIRRRAKSRRASKRRNRK